MIHIRTFHAVGSNSYRICGKGGSASQRAAEWQRLCEPQIVFRHRPSRAKAHPLQRTGLGRDRLQV